jgi:AcrR family transcriptional regulator
MGGRPKKLDTPAKVAMAMALYADQSHSITDICKSVGVSRATLYRYLGKHVTPDAAAADR